MISDTAARACKEIVQCQGRLKLRPVDVAILWFQDEHKKDILSIVKVGGSAKPCGVVHKTFGMCCGCT